MTFFFVHSQISFASPKASITDSWCNSVGTGPVVPAGIPVLWKDVARRGFEGVVEIQSSDLPLVDARVSDLIRVINEEARSVMTSEGKHREVVFIQLYGVRVDKHRLVEILVPGHFGGCPRLIATTKLVSSIAERDIKTQDAEAMVGTGWATLAT
ncbi:hypothetical protein GQ600_762 [Phytophthora cactorum]|nr:hypothetical protein GQ600_762 [Phytophthora cactorum]